MEPEKINSSEVPEKYRYSHSQLAIYNDCESCFYWQYKAPEEKRLKTIGNKYMARGKKIHKQFSERFVKRDYSDCSPRFQTFVNRWLPNPVPETAEYPDNLKILDWNFCLWCGSLDVKSYLDPETLVIMDLKTGWTEVDDEQLETYNVLELDDNPEVRNFITMYYYTDMDYHTPPKRMTREEVEGKRLQLQDKCFEIESKPIEPEAWKETPCDRCKSCPRLRDCFTARKFAIPRLETIEDAQVVAGVIQQAKAFTKNLEEILKDFLIRNDITCLFYDNNSVKFQLSSSVEMRSSVFNKKDADKLKEFEVLKAEFIPAVKIEIVSPEKKEQVEIDKPIEKEKQAYKVPEIPDKIVDKLVENIESSFNVKVEPSGSNTAIAIIPTEESKKEQDQDSEEKDDFVYPESITAELVIEELFKAGALKEKTFNAFDIYLSQTRQDKKTYSRMTDRSRKVMMKKLYKQAITGTFKKAIEPQPKLEDAKPITEISAKEENPFEISFDEKLVEPKEIKPAQVVEEKKIEEVTPEYLASGLGKVADLLIHSGIITRRSTVGDFLEQKTKSKWINLSDAAKLELSKILLKKIREEIPGFIEKYSPIDSLKNEIRAKGMFLNYPEDTIAKMVSEIKDIKELQNVVLEFEKEIK